MWRRLGGGAGRPSSDFYAVSAAVGAWERSGRSLRFIVRLWVVRKRAGGAGRAWDGQRPPRRWRPRRSLPTTAAPTQLTAHPRPTPQVRTGLWSPQGRLHAQGRAAQDGARTRVHGTASRARQPPFPFALTTKPSRSSKHHRHYAPPLHHRRTVAARRYAVARALARPPAAVDRVCAAAGHSAVARNAHCGGRPGHRPPGGRRRGRRQRATASRDDERVPWRYAPQVREGRVDA